MKTRISPRCLNQAVGVVVESIESRQLMAITLPVSVNFQPATSAIPAGMIADTGATYSTRNGHTYGWESYVSANAVQRITNYTPNQQSKTFIDMQKGGNHKWEFALDSGKYLVTIAAGDPSLFDSQLNITAEGITVVKGITTSDKRFYKSTKTIDVTDSKLTITNGTGAVNNKILFVTIASAVDTGGGTGTSNGSISGHVFADNNLNGTFDLGEPVGTGRTVFLDLNANDKLDTGEKSTLTDATGKYLFNDLVAGEYHVRRVFPTGYSQSNIPINIALAAGQIITDANIGSILGTGTGTGGTTTGVDFAKLQWTLGKPGPVARVEPEAASVDNIVYVFSGYNNTNWQAIPRVDKYNPDTDTWTRVADMPVPVTHGATAVVGKKIWIAGGHAARPGTIDRQNIGITNVQIYDTVTNTWSNGPDLPAKRTSGGLALVNNKLYFITGEDNTDTIKTDTWVLDLSNQAAGWKSRAPIPEGRSHFGTAVVDGIIYAMAGQVGTDEASIMLKTAYSYNPESNIWTKLPDLPSPRSHITPNLHSIDGNILMFGGEYQHNHPLAEVLMFSPKTGKYTQLTPLTHPTGNGVAAYIHGKIIFYGGRTNTFTADTYIGTFV